MRFFREKQLLSILLLLGVAIRVFQFLVPRSFYHDEALLAQNILDLSFPELTGALLFNQAAPFGFLWLTKALVSLLGNYEYVFHLIPAISGIVALFIFHKIARQLLPPAFALIALAFFVFNGHLIFYTHAFKQYESDVLTGLILTAGFLHFSQTRSSLKEWLMGGFIAAILIYFSQPSIFFFVGGTLVLSFLFWSKQQYDALKSLLLAAGIWGASFLVYFFFFLRPSLSNNFLQNYHADYYMPLSFWKWESLQWYARTFIGFYDNPGAIHFNVGGAIFGLAGIVRSIWKKSPKYLMLLMPFLLAVGASAFGKYSTIGRLFLFAVPAIIIFMVKGIELFAHFLSRWSPQYGPLISYAFTGILMLQSFLNNAIHHIAKPPKVENIRPVLSILELKKQPGDLLYIYAHAEPQFRYYRQKYNLAGLEIHLGRNPYNPTFKKDFDGLKNHKRVWVLLSHYKRMNGIRDDQVFPEILAKFCIQKEVFQEEGCVLFLYDCTQK